MRKFPVPAVLHPSWRLRTFAVELENEKIDRNGKHETTLFAEVKVLGESNGAKRKTHRRGPLLLYFKVPYFNGWKIN